MKKGEIWLVEILATTGHEQTGLRPAIVMAEMEANIVIIIPFTSNLQALRFPHVLEVKPSKRNGLCVISSALIFQIRAIDKQKLKKKVGDIEESALAEINIMLKKILTL